MKLIGLFFLTMVCIFVLDMIWLGAIAKSVYAQNIGMLLRKSGESMAPIWWKNMGAAIRGEVPVQTALDNMAQQADSLLAQLQQKGMSKCTPKLNAKMPLNFWYNKGTAPFPKLRNEKPKGETQSYENSLKY